MTGFEQTEQFILGRWGEKLVRDRLAELGHWVTDTSTLEGRNGHGPRVYGPGNLVPADLEVTLRPWGFRVDLQVKTKSRPDRGRITRELEHGFAWRDWLRYREAENLLGVPTFVVVVEADSGLILARRAKDLKVRKDCPTLNRGERMAYFPRSEFREDGIAHLERCAQRWSEGSTAVRSRRPPNPDQGTML